MIVWWSNEIPDLFVDPDRIGAQKGKIKTSEFTLGILEGLSDMDGFTHGGRCGALASCTCFRSALRAQRRLSERSWRRAMHRMLTIYYSRSCRGVKAAKDAARKTRYITGGGRGGAVGKGACPGVEIAVQYLSLFLLPASPGERLCFKR